MDLQTLTRTPWGRWPLPALLGWAGAWGAWLACIGVGLPAAGTLALALLPPLAVATGVAGRIRQALVVAGFPVSALLLGAAELPPWTWLLPLAALLLLYPLQAWRDAPLYPTPADALEGLRHRLALPPAARMLDAGCGLGDGLQALAREWPDARLTGIERSAALALLARLRVPDATVRAGDMWRTDWGGHDLVYLFQRPESMAAAWAKAGREMAPGSWLLSLEFVVPGLAPTLWLQRAGGRMVLAYRIESAEQRGGNLAVEAQPARRQADKRD